MNTRILMSFAMANHGANFANWLRDRLMKEYKLYHVKAVYVDSVVARSGMTRHAMQFARTDKAPMGVASVSPDKRPHMRSPTGAHPIGAMRDDWNTLYTEAMKQAEVMLFVYTEEYINSIWCMKEWGQFHLENERRRIRKQTRLRGILLEFSPGGNLVGIAEGHITRLPVEKTDGMRTGLAWDKGDFVLNPGDMKRLIEAIGPL